VKNSTPEQFKNRGQGKENCLTRKMDRIQVSFFNKTSGNFPSKLKKYIPGLKFPTGKFKRVIVPEK
jgi:hypothetical protein